MNPRLLRALAVAVVVLGGVGLLAAGVSGGNDDTPGAGSDPELSASQDTTVPTFPGGATIPTTPTTAAPPSDAGDGTQPGADAKGDAKATTADNQSTPSTLPRFRYELKVTPSCVEVGDKVVATIKTRPNNHVTVVAQYSDGQPHKAMTMDKSNAAGIFVYEWTVPEDAPHGDGTVVTESYDEATVSVGNETAPFRVAGDEGCG